MEDLRRIDEGEKGDDRERIYEHIYDTVLKVRCIDVVCIWI